MNATSVSDTDSELDRGQVAVCRDGLEGPEVRSSFRPRSKVLATRFGIAGLATALVVTGILLAEHYWTTGQFVESTDDAYVKADSSTVAPKISGYVSSVLVDDKQLVKAGQVLAHIDVGDLQTALDEADANVTAATASVAGFTPQLAAQESVISQAEATVAVADTSLALSKRNGERRRAMAKVGYGSDEQSDNAAADSVEKSPVLTREKVAVRTARQQIQVLNAQREIERAQFLRAQALRNESYAVGKAGIVQILATQGLQQLAELGLVQARVQRYADTVRPFLAAGGGLT